MSSRREWDTNIYFMDLVQPEYDLCRDSDNDSDKFSVCTYIDTCQFTTIHYLQLYRYIHTYVHM